MGDRSTGSMMIGGTIRDGEQLRKFIDALNEDLASVDWSGEPDDWLAFLVERAVDEGDSLCIDTGEHEINGGEMYVVQEACQELGLHYLASWNACPGAYSSGETRYNPNVILPTGQPVCDSQIVTEHGDMRLDISLSRLKEMHDNGSLGPHLEWLELVWSRIPAFVVLESAFAEYAAKYGTKGDEPT